MKKPVLTVVASLVLACILLNIAPSLFQNTNLAWIKLDSLSLRRNGYIRRGQWLADGRTLIEAIRFLRLASMSGPGSAGVSSDIHVINNPGLSPTQPRPSTNLFTADETEPTLVFQKRRLSRVESLIVRKRILPSFGPAPVFSVADLSFIGQSAGPSVDGAGKNPDAAVRTALLRCPALSTNTAASCGRRLTPNA
jgi:hypothetical protein